MTAITDEGIRRSSLADACLSAPALFLLFLLLVIDRGSFLTETFEGISSLVIMRPFGTSLLTSFELLHCLITLSSTIP